MFLSRGAPSCRKRELVKRKKPSGNKKKLLFLATGFFTVWLVFLLFWFLGRPLIVFKKIDLQTDARDCVASSTVLGYLNLGETNYFAFDPGSLSKKLQDKFFCLGTVEIKKSFPDTLSIRLKKRQPAVSIRGYKLPDLGFSLSEATSSTQAAEVADAFKKAPLSGHFVADSTGFVFARQESGLNLPELDVYGDDVRLGRAVPEGAVEAVLQISGRLDKLAVPPAKFRKVGRSLYLESKLAVNFSLEKELARQLAELEIILEQARLEAKGVEKVDLRFNKAVVVYSKKAR